MRINIRSYLNHENLLLLLIILVGSTLRLWRFWDVPFMHDELSALSRLQFDNFNDLIKYGVMLGDTHPAGVQVFLYYWTSIFGTSEIIVKIPFVLAGIASIFIGYRVGKTWFDGTTGLFVSSIIASTQIFVLYSQIARPYVSGLLITMLMVHFWSLYFFKKKKILYLGLFVLFASLASYNHHFSLLFSAIVGLTGLFLINSKKDLLQYAIAGIVIFILYIPHLEIFLSQLSQGGIGGAEGWLKKPDHDFVFQFFNYLMQFSLWGWISLIGIIVFAIFIPDNKIHSNGSKRKRWILVIWFMLPIIIGYVYSIVRNPIIQYSMLLFSTPYIFIFVFSFHRKLGVWQKTIVIVILLVINSTILVFGRQHYIQFYHQPYQELFETALINNNRDDVFIIDDCIPFYHDYYFDKYKSIVPYFTKRNSETDIVDFENMVSEIENNTLITHALTGEELQIVQYYFPYIVGYTEGFTYEINTFKKVKSPSDEIIERKLIAYTDFVNQIGNWKDKSEFNAVDSIYNNRYCRLSSDDEWGPFVTINLSDNGINKIGIVDIEVDMMMSDTISNVFLIANLTDGEESLLWRSSNFKSYDPEEGKWRRMFLSIDVDFALKDINNYNDFELRINIWNKSNQIVLIDNFKIFQKRSNINRYSLYNKIYN